jgi:glucuronosyltransferase
MKKITALSQDEAQSSLNRAVWWAQYIIGHYGATQLRSAAIDLAWYQHLLLDLAAFLIVV